MTTMPPHHRAELQCYSCGHHQFVTDDLSGEIVFCPQCGKETKVLPQQPSDRRDNLRFNVGNTYAYLGLVHGSCPVVDISRSGVAFNTWGLDREFEPGRALCLDIEYCGKTVIRNITARVVRHRRCIAACSFELPEGAEASMGKVLDKILTAECTANSSGPASSVKSTRLGRVFFS